MNVKMHGGVQIIGGLLASSNKKAVYLGWKNINANKEYENA
jgi:hypothetical protein